MNVSISSVLPQFDPPEARRKLGLIALATDLTTERDFPRIVPLDKAVVYGTRVAFENPTTPENLRKMGPLISAAADLLVPGEVLDAICYSCTAASVVIGDEEVAAAVHASRPGVPVVTPTGAALKAFAVLGVNRVSVVTPYLVETSMPMADYFIRSGLELQAFNCLGQADDRVMARISQQTIIDAAIEVDTPATEAFFLSCTGLPALDAIAEIEQRTGKPVVSSNQASAWEMMQHSGLNHVPKGYGKLFSCSLPASGSV